MPEHGGAQLSSVLNGNIAIDVNIQIIHTFVAMRQRIVNSPVDKNVQLQQEMKELKEYIEEVFVDQNDINEDTRMQIELINQVLAELEVRNKE